MIVRKELEKVLANKGLTKAGFARLLGVTPQYIGQVMAGKRPLHKHTIEQIEGVLHLRPGTLTTSGGTSSGQGTASALNLMEGVEVAYLEICMEAVAEARHMLRRQRIDKALTKARGKDDTRFFDLAPEYAIVECLREFDRECAIFTEEGTTDDCRQFANRLAFFIDPFDRSIPFSDALQSMRSKGDYIADAIDHPDWPLHGLDAPFASITCLRESQVVFNVMADYVSGEVYVACKAMLKHGSIDRCHNPETVASRGVDITFEPRMGTDFITFVGHKGSAKREQYEQHLKDLSFDINDLPEERYQVPGGPARILHLSHITSSSSQNQQRLTEDFRPAFIMSNGEKICEWIGWLAYATHSAQLHAYELIAEKVSARDYVLLAPPPNYSLFSPKENACMLKLDRVTGLDTPVTFRSAIVVTHLSSADAIVRFKAMPKERCRELRLFIGSP